MIEVRSSRLVLKPFSSEYASDFAEAVRESVDVVGEWMPWCHKDYSVEEAEEWFALCSRNIQSEEGYDIGIFMADEDIVVGGISINQINRQHNIGNIGYWVRGTYQQQGIATEAVSLIKSLGFGVLGLTRLEIVVLEKNVASRRVAEKAGAEFECISRNRLVHNGAAKSAAVYSLIPE